MVFCVHVVCDIVWKIPLRDVVGLKSRGCRKLRREKAGVPARINQPTSHVKLAGVVPMDAAAAVVDVVPLLLHCAGAFGIQSKYGWESSSSLC